MDNKVLGIDVTTANADKLNMILGALNRNKVTTQNNRQNQIDSFTLGTDQFTNQIVQIDANIAKVTAAIAELQ